MVFLRRSFSELFYLHSRGALNATSTLVSLDFYKPVINKQATDAQIARAGKMVTVIVGLVSVIVAPFISFAPLDFINLYKSSMDYIICRF